MILLYKIRYSILAVITIISVGIVFWISPVPQDLSYHLFADQRRLFGVPNFLNVITNLPFLIVGVYGLAMLKGFKIELTEIMNVVLFMGIFFIGIGSAIYHYEPGNNTLVYDRLPMTIVFMSFLAIVIARFINQVLGTWLFIPLLTLGIWSVLWWHHTELMGQGDLRFYGFVQFYTMQMIPLIVLLFPSEEYKKCSGLLVWAVLWYGVAKIFEYYDQKIYTDLHFISGHSLKHIAASISVFYIARTIRITGPL